MSAAMELEDEYEGETPGETYSGSDMEEYSVEGDAESLCNDLDALLESAVNTDAVLQVMEEKTKGLLELFEKHECIYITYNEVRMELKDVIDALHAESVKSIQEGREMTFGPELLKALESYIS